MAKRKRTPSEMPPDIDFDEWEAMVQDKKTQLEFDNSFLALQEWLQLAGAAADCIDHQFRSVFPDREEKEVLDAFLGELQGIGCAMEDPDSYIFDCDNVDEFANEMSKYTTKSLPAPLADLLNRLVFYAAKWGKDMRHNNPDIYDY